MVLIGCYGVWLKSDYLLFEVCLFVMLSLSRLCRLRVAKIGSNQVTGTLATAPTPASGGESDVQVEKGAVKIEAKRGQ